MTDLVTQMTAEIERRRLELRVLRRAVAVLRSSAPAPRPPVAEPTPHLSAAEIIAGILVAPPPPELRPALAIVPTGPAKTKQCIRQQCRKFKPIVEFYKNAAQKDGRALWCKACVTSARTEKAGKTQPGKHRPKSTIPDERPSGRKVRCKACSHELIAAKASQHAWDTHKQAINSRKLDTHFEDVA